MSTTVPGLLNRVAWTNALAAALASGLAFLGGLALSRVLYEAFFPDLLLLGQPLPVLFLGTAVAVLGWWLWRWLAHSSGSWPAVTPFLPLVLNLLYLLDPTVDLVRSRLIFVASLWTMVLFWRVRPDHWWLVDGRWPVAIAGRWPVLLLMFAILPVYLLTMGRTVGRADTFEFQVVAPQLGIAHPTGYPLYLLLAKLFSLIPLESVAWRVNLATVVLGLAAVSVVYLLVWRISARPLPALLAAVLLALSSTFWREAIEAEVYTLHALIVAASLLLMAGLLTGKEKGPSLAGRRPLVALFFILGLGLTNHLTTLFLLPPAFLTLFFVYFSNDLKNRFTSDDCQKASNPGSGAPISNSPSATAGYRLPIALLAAFLLPLSLYAYLPLRWLAVNGEPMGLARFVDWVVGGRFRGALQLSAWLQDPTRYEVVGRLLLTEWQWYGLAWAAFGFIALLVVHRRLALVTFVTWLGFIFYCLNYYVPDLDVFLLPAHLVMAIWWGFGLAVLFQALHWALAINNEWISPAAGATWLAFSLPLLVAAATYWPAVDRSRDDGLTQWGLGVLAMPLAANAAILADSEKIAPLYYLQQVEGVRPDLDIMVLPDEAAYRAELDRRVAAGQTVYLARFLPGLEGVYHLRSVGPLIEVSRAPLTSLPAGAQASPLALGTMRLLAYEIEPVAAVDPATTAVTFYWQAEEPPDEVKYVYVRWANQMPNTSVAGDSSGDEMNWRLPSTPGQHPANNYYPTVAWRPGEIVADFHLLSRPVLAKANTFTLQVALAPPFSQPDSLDWQTVTTVELSPTRPDELDWRRPLSLQVGSVALIAADFAQQVRPGTSLLLFLTGQGHAIDRLHFALHPTGPGLTEEGPDNLFAVPNSGRQSEPAANGQGPLPKNDSSPLVWSIQLPTDLPNGRYHLVASYPGLPARCGWLATRRDNCVLGQVEISGVPLPEGATNFEDKVALLFIDVPEVQLRPGGQLAVQLTWQALAPMNEDYTVFVQVLDSHDRLAGQVDAWPLHGTYPTSQWETGEVVRDPYVVQLSADLPPGSYRLQVGWYLLSTLRRLPVLNEEGTAVDDRVLVTGLVAP